MKIEIDQSGKIEQTDKNTILCLSNDLWYTVKIPAQVKRQFQMLFREKGKIRDFILHTFCAGLSLLLLRIRPNTRITVDQEYQGQTKAIIKILKQILGDSELVTLLAFKRIGKESKADYWAGEVASGTKQSTWVLSFEELWEQIKKTEVGKRLADT